MSFSKYVLENTNKELSTLENKEIYIQLLNYVKEQADKKALNSDKKKVYYISAEFLIGKLLSNNLINLGIYEEIEKELVSEYLNRRDDETITEAMIRGIYSSVSDYAIVTMQDLLDKDATSRMNVPSTVGGNWEWRMLVEDLTEERKEFLRNITVRYSRERV